MELNAILRARGSVMVGETGRKWGYSECSSERIAIVPLKALAISRKERRRK